jgi:hypothetical protein
MTVSYHTVEEISWGISRFLLWDDTILRKHSSLFDMSVTYITVETATSGSGPVHVHMAAVQMLA